MGKILKNITNKGLDEELQEYKLPTNYVGLEGYWSDVDGWSRTLTDPETFVMIEEKAFCNWNTEANCIENNDWIVSQMKCPAIVFFTSTRRDDKADGKKNVVLHNSLVADFRTNRADFYSFFQKQLWGKECPEVPQKTWALSHNPLELKDAVKIWYKFIEEKL